MNRTKAIVVPEIAAHWGGPSVSVPALARAMHALDASVRLYFVSSERDLDWPEYFCPQPPSPPGWLRRSTALAHSLASEPLDVVHHHGLWLPSLGYASRAARRQGRPLVISPRGMMSSYALARSRWKKRLARWFIHPGAFEHAAGWHATSDDEAEEIRAAGFRQPVVVAANGVDVPRWNETTDRALWLARHPELADKRVLLFYSRLHSKKGVLPLLEAWRDLAAAHPHWRLLVCGIPEEYTAAQLRQRAGELGIANRTTITDEQQLAKPYRLAELYVLPTQSENFGLTIAESLASGVPVVTTTGTPWRELDARHCGRRVEPARIVEPLGELLAADSATLAAMGQRGAEWVRGEFSWEKQARLLLDFYESLAGAAAAQAVH